MTEPGIREKAGSAPSGFRTANLVKTKDILQYRKKGTNMREVKHILLTAAVFSLTVFVSVFAADDKAEDSLWGYADPTADIVIYVNTKHSEKTMERNLWNRIQKDKERAIVRNSRDQLFDMKNRDMELVANFRILSVEPFTGTVDGVANITGNLLGDIEKLSEMLKEDSGITPQVSKQDDMDFYSFPMPEMEGLPGGNCMLVPVSPNQIQFRIDLSSKDPVPKKVLNRSSGSSPALGKVNSQDLMFACVISSARIAGLDLGEETEGISEFLKKVDDIVFSAFVAGEQMKLNCIFAFKSETQAADFANDLKPLMTDMKSLTGFETSPNISKIGKDVTIMLPVNIADAWDLITKITSQEIEDDEEADAADGKSSAPLSPNPK